MSDRAADPLLRLQAEALPEAERNDSRPHCRIKVFEGELRAMLLAAPRAAHEGAEENEVELRPGRAIHNHSPIPVVQRIRDSQWELAPVRLWRLCFERNVKRPGCLSGCNHVGLGVFWVRKGLRRRLT